MILKSFLITKVVIVVNYLKGVCDENLNLKDGKKLVKEHHHEEEAIIFKEKKLIGDD